MNQSRGVSVIIPCHNDWRYLADALGSLSAQDSDLPFEVLIIDDGSDLGGLEEIESVARRFPELEIAVISLPVNQGSSVARNVGLERARHDYIFPLDVDNRLSTDRDLILDGQGYMDRAVAILESDEDIVFVHCRGEYIGAKSGPCDLAPFNEKHLLTNNMLDARIIYRRTEALDAGEYNPDVRSAEDWDFALAMLNHRHKSGLPAKVINLVEPLFQYRYRGDGSNKLAKRAPDFNGPSRFERTFQRSPEIFRKHFPQVTDEDMPAFLARRRKWRKLRSDALKDLVSLFRPSMWPRIPGRLSQGMQKVRRALDR